MSTPKGTFDFRAQGWYNSSILEKVGKSAMLDRLKTKTLVLDLAADIVGSILYAAGIYTFASTADFAPGGISGLALILNYLWGLPIGVMTLVINIPIILVSYRVLGRRFLLKSLRTMVINTAMVDLMFPLFPTYRGSQLLAALFAGVLLGAGLALIYMRGSSTGGADFIILSVKKLRPHLSVGQVTMVFDLLVILLGWPVYGNVDSVLYGIIAAFAASIVVDKIMYGMGAGRLNIIITAHPAEVARRIDENCGRGATRIQAQGSYSGKELTVLLCACSKSEAYKVRAAAHEVDPDAFVMITETSEVFGEGFLDPRAT